MFLNDVLRVIGKRIINAVIVKNLNNSDFIISDENCIYLLDDSWSTKIPSDINKIKIIYEHEDIPDPNIKKLDDKYNELHDLFNKKITTINTNPPVPPPVPPPVLPPTPPTPTSPTHKPTNFEDDRLEKIEQKLNELSNQNNKNPVYNNNIHIGINTSDSSTEHKIDNNNNNEEPVGGNNLEEILLELQRGNNEIIKRLKKKMNGSILSEIPTRHHLGLMSPTAFPQYAPVNFTQNSVANSNSNSNALSNPITNAISGSTSGSTSGATSGAASNPGGFAAPGSPSGPGAGSGAGSGAGPGAGPGGSQSGRGRAIQYGGHEKSINQLINERRLNGGIFNIFSPKKQQKYTDENFGQTDVENFIIEDTSGKSISKFISNINKLASSNSKNSDNYKLYNNDQINPISITYTVPTLKSVYKNIASFIRIKTSIDNGIKDIKNNVNKDLDYYIESVKVELEKIVNSMSSPPFNLINYNDDGTFNEEPLKKNKINIHKLRNINQYIVDLLKEIKTKIIEIYKNINLSTNDKKYIIKINNLYEKYTSIKKDKNQIKINDKVVCTVDTTKEAGIVKNINEYTVILDTKNEFNKDDCEINYNEYFDLKYGFKRGEHLVCKSNGKVVEGVLTNIKLFNLDNNPEFDVTLDKNEKQLFNVKDCERKHEFYLRNLDRKRKTAIINKQIEKLNTITELI